ncbi:ComEC/Rec2 family competence protein [Flavobacterium sp.]|uniref:ComEC/Rec2 family competence protein n=1 Tax=Flavobacterium sp. TaxID=239 RepID=UPI00375001EC
MKVLQFPLIKITIFFLFGIVFSHFSSLSFKFTISLLIANFLILVVSFFTFKKRFFGVFTLATAFFIGSFTLICNNETRNLNHYTYKINAFYEIYNCEVTVLEKLKNTTKNDRYIVKITSINDTLSTGELILNIRKETVLPTIAIGSNLKVKGSFYKNRNPNNPNQFDYGKYLENKQIYAQIYADLKDVQLSTLVDKNLNYYASKIRNKIIFNLEKNKFSKSELSVVNALILGQQQDISKEVVLDYQYAGAIHVLSVSGLHVGFILLFVTFLLRPIPNTKFGLTLKLIIALISLWLFGLLAGLAPCVIRSVTMFSFVAVGLYLRRTVNIYNTLMISVLLILLVEPSYLFDIGFQLSYVALFFIIWLQPLLARIWVPKYKFVTYFWEIITVSFAAQIGTLPMTIYYFHQFPGLFFITNLIILPALTFILALGVLVLSLAAFDIVWFPIMKLLESSITILNKIISWIASFESFIFKDISVSTLMMISGYILIISWIIWFQKPSFKKLSIAFLTVILFQIVTIYTKHDNQKATEFIVFSKSKTSIITERKGQKVSLYSTDSILKNVSDNLAIKSYLVANFCSIENKKSIGNVFYFKGKKIVLIDSSAIYLNDKKPDILILTHSPKLSLERVFKSWKPEQVVVDASNFKSYIKIWKATCEKEKIPFHATGEKGFYKL